MKGKKVNTTVTFFRWRVGDVMGKRNVGIIINIKKGRIKKRKNKLKESEKDMHVVVSQPFVTLRRFP